MRRSYAVAALIGLLVVCFGAIIGISRSRSASEPNPAQVAARFAWSVDHFDFHRACTYTDAKNSACDGGLFGFIVNTYQEEVFGLIAQVLPLGHETSVVSWKQKDGDELARVTFSSGDIVYLVKLRKHGWRVTHVHLDTSGH